MTIPMNTLTNLPQFLLDDERYKSLEDDEVLAAGDWIEWSYGAATEVLPQTDPTAWTLVGAPVNSLPWVFNPHPAVNAKQAPRAWRALTAEEITSAVLNNLWRREEMDAAGFI